MHELLAQVETHLRMAWRYRWFGLMLTVVVCLVGWTTVLLMPDRYSAAAKVQIDTSSMLTPALRGIALVDSSRRSAIETVQRLLFTRPNLEAIVRAVDLDLKAKTPQELDAVVAELGRTVRVVSGRGSDIYSISYESAEPQLAHRVVEAVLNHFVERSLGAARKDTTTTREFLQQQIKEHEERLRQAEVRVTQFKRQNLGTMPGSEHGHFQAQQAARNAVREASLQLQEAERRREELALQLEDVNQWFDEAAPPPAAVSHPLDSRIQSLESGLDQMLLKYTERHPDVVSTRRLIAELQAKRDEEVRASASGAAGGHSRDRMENPLYQQISIALGAAESEVAALQARVEEYKRRDTELGQRVDRALQVESEEAALNRDYEAIGRNYSTLVARLESLNIADEAAKSSESFKFNVVDPPRVPTEPSAPNRPVMNATILGVAFAAGGGLAWLLAMIRPAVYGRESVRDFTDLPLLGTIARVMSPREVREHWVRLGLFLGGSAAMLGAYGFIVLFESPVAQAVSRLRDVVVQII